MVLSAFQNVQILSNTRNQFAFVGYTDRDGAHAARRGGDRDAAKGAVPQTWKWHPHPYMVMYLGPGMGVPSHSPWC